MRNWHGNLSPFGKWHTAGSRVFSPAILFAGGEAGVWYDPSDLTTLFQDTAGTIPVTTAGQTVALMLDKSQGATLGSENVPAPLWSGVVNGTTTPPTGWTNTGWYEDSDGTYSVSAGTISITNVSGRTGCYFPMATTPGYSYRVEYTGFSGASANIRATSVIDPNAIIPARYPSDSLGGDRSLIFVAISSVTYVSFTNYGSGGTTVQITDLSVRELPGYHATQPTAAARPTYQTDGTLHWLEFDGIDDFMVTPTITPGIDKVQVFAGVRKLSDASTGVYVELGNDSISNSGAFVLFNSASSTVNGFGFLSRGTIIASALATAGFVPPVTAVLTALGDIASDSAILRGNGSGIATSGGDQGTGNYLAYPMYIGRRGGTSLPLTGNIYSLITRFGANLEASTIETTETYVAGKTGVDL